MTPDAFYPGIHDKMGGGFSARCIGIMNMVVKRDLIPQLGHFQKMVLPEQSPDYPGLAKSRHPKRMRQLKLQSVIVLCPNQFLHDLEKNPGSIFRHGTVCGIENFIFQSLERLQPVFHRSSFLGFKKMDNGISRSETFGFNQFFYAQRMKKWIIGLAGIAGGLFYIIYRIDNPDQVMVPSVKK